MPIPNARRTLYVLGFAAVALVAIIAASLAARPGTMQGAASAGHASSLQEPTWQQLLGRSVQARKAGAVREAEALLRQAVTLAATFGPNDMRRAHTRMAQAEFHLWSGQPELAEPAYREAVTIGQAAGGTHHPELVSLLEGLANFYFYREHYDEVVPLHAHILEIVRATKPYDAHEEARRLRNLAQVEQLRSRHAEASALNVRALELIETSPRRTPGETAEYLQAAAESYRAGAKAHLAQPLAIRALGLMESLAGPEALDVVPYLKTLADTSMEAGQPQRAGRLYERAIAIVERVSGPGHPDLAPYLLGLGSALQFQGKPAEADNHFARARQVGDVTRQPRGTTAPATR